jgi:hypothetical protein
MDKTLRLRNSYGAVGIVSLFFFAGMMGFSFVAFFRDNMPGAVCFSGFWGAWIVVSVWLLAAYYRESVSVDECRIVQQGILRRREMAFADVANARWRTMPRGGAVVLRSLTGKIKVCFDNFGLEERRWLIRHLRLSLPQSVQQDWDRFCVRNALPLAKHDADAPLQPGEVLLTKRRWDRFFLVLTATTAVVSAVCARVLEYPPALVLPVICLLMWLMIRFYTPAKGMRDKRLSANPEKGYFLFLLIWGPVGVTAVMPLSYGQFDLAIGVLVLWFTVLVNQSYRLDRRREAAKDAVAPEAVLEWDRLEGQAGESESEQARRAGV